MSEYHWSFVALYQRQMGQVVYDRNRRTVIARLTRSVVMSDRAARTEVR